VTTIRPLAESFQSMTQRLRALIEGQQEFTNALSHELRTPLARIKFGLEMLKEDLPASAKNELQNLRQDVQEIDELIGSMLDYARLEHPDLEIRWQSVPAQQLVNENVSKFQHGKRMVKIEVANDVGSSEVECDPYLMGLSLSNLLSNALRYAKTRVCVNFQQLGHSWHLQVDDDGPGIPKNSREQVLKAFARLDDSRDRGTGGYGLGLAIVSRIASLHGGSINIEQSTLGGARFSLCWPVKQVVGG
ncbi:MAG: ATP-binding protein, partial [Pseudomonadales bacterium]